MPADFKNPAAGSYQIAIHPHKTIAELKHLISLKANIPEDELILKTSSNLNEIKDLSVTIKQGISPNYNLLLIRGIVLKPNQLRFSLLLSVPSNKLIKDGEFFTFYNLFDLPLEIDKKIRDLKEKLIENIKETYPTLIINHCRIREIQAEKLSRWLDDLNPLSEFKNVDGKRLAVEMLDAEDPVKDKDDIIIAVRKFIPSTWELEKAIEIKINSKIILSQLGDILSQAFNIPVFFYVGRKYTNL